jgi:hypothetical protein
MDMKRFFLYAIAIAALALAGCGGNGGTPMEMEMPDPPDTTMPPPGEDDATDEDDATAGLTPTALQAAMAIFLPDRNDKGQGLYADGRPNANRVLAVAPGTGAVSVDEDGLAKDDPKIMDSEEFTSADYSRASVTGLNSKVYDRTVEGVTDEITIYADKKAAKDSRYNVFYAPTDPENAETPEAADRDGVAARTDDGKLTLSMGDIGKTTAKLFSADRFPSGVDTNVVTYVNDTDTTADDRKFAGTFNGIPGTFACDNGNDACTATGNAKGLTNLSDGWTFTPDATNPIVRGALPDTDFLTFGYWVQETVKDDGTVSYGVSPFWGGSLAFLDANIDALTGSATYSGSATGMYVRKTSTVGADGRPSATPESAGQFTADANLTAYFGQTTTNTIAASALFSIKGTVSDFENGDGDMIDSQWEVGLKGVGPMEPGASFDGMEGTGGTTHTATFSGATTTGPGSTAGEWNGGFFGPATADDADTMDVDESHPTGVAGEFNAHFDNGHVIGGFGATR